MSGFEMKKTRIEEEIVNYALQKGNFESFAKLLNEILPIYTTWTWGQDGIYRRYFEVVGFVWTTESSF